MKMLFSPEELEEIRTALTVNKDFSERIISEAEDVLNHRIRVLGLGRIDFGKQIQWSEDPESKVSWPEKKYYGFWKLMSKRPENTDLRLLWELSRAHHLVTLGLADRASGKSREGGEKAKRRSPEEFEKQVSSWIKENPVGFGPNWIHAMEAGIRAANWITAYCLFGSPERFSIGFRRDFEKSLTEHARFIRAHPEKGGVTGVSGNHHVCGMAGLLFIGTFLKKTDKEGEAEEWVSFASTELEKCAENQVLPDGCHFEMSVSYHRLVLEAFIFSAMIAPSAGIKLPKTEDAVRRMSVFLKACLRPDGSVPVIGDDDGARFLGVVPYGSRYEWTVAASESLFKERVAEGTEGKSAKAGCWASVIAPESLVNKKHGKRELGTSSSSAFKSAGFFTMKSENSSTAIRCGPVGMNGIGAHSHNDALSFDLWSFGRPVLSDSGSYEYSRSAAARDRFRGTASHNTIMIDGAEINPLGPGAFRMKDNARAELKEWSSDGKHDVFDGLHHGYETLKSPATHERRIIFDKATDSWTIRDTINAPNIKDKRFSLKSGNSRESAENARHKVSLSIHSAPGGTFRETKKPEEPKVAEPKKTEPEESVGSEEERRSASGFEPKARFTLAFNDGVRAEIEVFCAARGCAGDGADGPAKCGGCEAEVIKSEVSREYGSKEGSHCLRVEAKCAPPIVMTTLIKVRKEKKEALNP